MVATVILLRTPAEPAAHRAGEQQDAGTEAPAEPGNHITRGRRETRRRTLYAMKSLRFLVALTGFALAILVASHPAQANVFCPVTIGTLTNLAILGRESTYGVLLDVDPGDTASVRLRVDSERTRYAVDVNDLPIADAGPLTARRYFMLPPGEHAIEAWVEATGRSPEARLDCPITRPYNANEPAPVDPRIIAERARHRRFLIDNFASKTPALTPTAFGMVEPQTCAQAFALARATLAEPPVYPTDARALHATGITTVRVDLDETSSVIGISVIRSSGYASLDRAAEDAARKSTYRTETFGCRSIASSFVTDVTFNTPSAPNTPSAQSTPSPSSTP
jgi:TonB family protein